MSPTDGERPARGVAHDTSQGGPRDRGRDPREDAGATGERFGELSLTRLEKDDGRSLILYAHPEQLEQ